MFLLKVLLPFLLIISSCFGIPQLCLKAKPWSINGRAFVDEFKGKILFLGFLKLDCPICMDIIQRLDTFMRTDGNTERFSHELSIVIVAPHSESDSRISLMQSKFPSIKIVKESHQEPLWGWLRVGHHDGLIFDRCGRLSKHLRIPRSSPEVLSELFNTFRTILTGHSCGFCSYDLASERRMAISITTPTPQVFAPQITAYVVPQPQKNVGAARNSQVPQVSEAKKYFTPVQANLGGGKNGGKIYAQQQQPGVFGSEEEVFTQQKSAPSIDATPAAGINGKNVPSSEAATIPKPLDPIYSDDVEVGGGGGGQVPSEYYDYVSEWTTPNPPQNVQIPKPTSPSSLWPTKIPTINQKFQSPCAGYTDDICYQQQTQLAASEIHKCCKSRILFTDQCLPGKCSNSTQQLCCIQKFLQAKLDCCSDEKQGEATSGTDKFSQCCYGKFVESDDLCCSHSYSHAQWKSVHELCLPHVFVDLSQIKVKTVVPGTSVTTDFHFGQTNRWKFECKYGAQVPQYSYFEEDDDSDPLTSDQIII
jgi:hypothetical protein